jgi:uracil-DNA glycosylase family 4
MTNPLERYGFDAREVRPQGSGALSVMIVGEAPGEQEADDGIPFNPKAPAGSVLERAIRRGGNTRDQFVITNVVPFRPPNNWLEGAPWEAEAISHGLSFLDDAIARYRPRALVALGSVATRALTGLAGRGLGIRNIAGFTVPSPRYGIPVVTGFHPSYLRRGAMSLFGTLMRSIKVATKVARERTEPEVPPVDNPPAGYVLYPDESAALEFERRAAEERLSIAYDIETPYSTDEDSAEEAEGTQTIKSIQFSLAPRTGIFMPWREPFIPIAKRILALPNPKLGWNTWRFDDPVLAANDCAINGDRHDLMWAWHHSQPDLPRGLQFAAAQSGWPWPWKHLAMASEQFYGIVDVDVLQWMVT